MSISDELMWRYIDLLSFSSQSEITKWKGEHPRDVKVRFAKEIVARFHSADAARQAEEEFEKRHRHGETPDDMPEVTLHAADGLAIAQVLKQAGLAPSATEAQRMIEQGGVKIDGDKVSDRTLKLGRGTVVIQVGKRKFARVRIA
jgi:tyrosyl-tRNA synthetase